MAHIRDPKRHLKPADVDERRMAIYRDLFFNNVEGFVSSGFPVLKSLYSEQAWLSLVRHFFSEHDCQSPYFLDIAAEFLVYLTEQYTITADDPVFLLELAHYEWVELDVSITNSDESEQLLASNDVSDAALYLANTARNLSYQYPVHTISVDNQPRHVSDQAHYFVVYRDHDDEVQFLATNSMTALLLAIIDSNAGIHLTEVCQQVAVHAPQFTDEQLFQGALATLSALAERGVIVTKNLY
ncbi:DUF2063 domain-containing protein [Pseudoalteromonas mariniglutinosa]|uniref:HvfC family RiPP maturation protein n=1 Tax=Pseudoalteromonas mariniglutinosa TaxID=206042 RepID=UPI00384FE5C9